MNKIRNFILGFFYKDYIDYLDGDNITIISDGVEWKMPVFFYTKVRVLYS